MLNILSIGGSDPSAAAGIQGDIKSCESLGAYCLSAVTAVTSQSTSRFGMVEPVSAGILKKQIAMIFSDFEIDAIKIGMVYSAGIIRAVHDSLRDMDVPIVLDPVIESTTGGMLIKRRTIPALVKYLVPLSTAITPNKSEAELLAGCKIDTRESVKRAARKIQKLGAKNVIITGLDVKRNHVADYVLTADRGCFIHQRSIPVENRGGGGGHSLALCYFLARKKTVIGAARQAMQFAYDSIEHSRKIGAGLHIVRPVQDGIRDKLLGGIGAFQGIRGIYKMIPECQTNFVFSRNEPASTSDILGICGRIVRSGKDVVMVGRLEYGGSRHVASAVLAVCRKFPSVRAAVNIRFHRDTVTRMAELGFLVNSYDRSMESHDIKKTENMSITWGAEEAIRHSKKAPDAIFHRGDYGKEPMIIVFGLDPADVADKIRKISA